MKLKLSFLTVLFLHSSLSLSFSQENQPLAWNYYESDEYVQKNARLLQLMNIPMEGCLQDDPYLAIEKMIENLKTLSSHASYSEFNDWEGEKILRTVYWSSVFDKDNSSVFQQSGDLLDYWMILDGSIYIFLGTWAKVDDEGFWHYRASSSLSPKAIASYLSADNAQEANLIQLASEDHIGLRIVPKDLEDFFYFRKVNNSWNKNIYCILNKEDYSLEFMYIYVLLNDGKDGAFDYKQTFSDRNGPIQLDKPDDYLENFQIDQ